MKSLIYLWALLPFLHLSHSTPTQFPAGTSRLSCQTSLTSCPNGTIIVSNNKNDPRAHFTSIQSAIDSLPNDNSSQTILILAGNYTEQLNITRSGPVTLLGQTSHPTDASQNKVTVFWAAANNGTYADNAYTSVLTVAPTLEASLTGSGPTGYPVPADTPFGNRDFRAYNIDFRNVFSEYSAGPALALSLSYANGGFYYCGFYSFQDTVAPPLPTYLALTIDCLCMCVCVLTTGGLHRQTRQRIHLLQHRRRPNRLPVRLRHRLAAILPSPPPQLRRGNNSLEGDKHNLLSQQIRGIHRRLADHCRQRYRRGGHTAQMRPWKAVE